MGLHKTMVSAVATTALLGLVWASRPVAAQDFTAIAAASDRTDADRTTDQRRKPQLLFQFAGVKTGMTVLDVAAGGGYSTEFLARSVGPTGKVYAQDQTTVSERAKASFDAREKTLALKNVVRVARPFDDPLPAEVANLDLVTLFFSYHDISFMAVDRAAMNRKIFAALKPGGSFVVADHSAKAGDGVNVAKSLHRIEEATLRSEIEAAGFKFVASGDFLRNPADPRDKPVARPEQPVDEFVLKFQRPG